MPNNPISRLMGLNSDYYANNDYWFDDTSDGPVSAEARIGGKSVTVKGGAWVLVVPPKFAPTSRPAGTAALEWRRSKRQSLITHALTASLLIPNYPPLPAPALSCALD